MHALLVHGEPASLARLLHLRLDGGGRHVSPYLLGLFWDEAGADDMAAGPQRHSGLADQGFACRISMKGYEVGYTSYKQNFPLHKPRTILL